MRRRDGHALPDSRSCHVDRWLIRMARPGPTRSRLSTLRGLDAHPIRWHTAGRPDRRRTGRRTPRSSQPPRLATSSRSQGSAKNGPRMCGNRFKRTATLAGPLDLAWSACASAGTGNQRTKPRHSRNADHPGDVVFLPRMWKALGPPDRNLSCSPLPCGRSRAGPPRFRPSEAHRTTPSPGWS